MVNNDAKMQAKILELLAAGPVMMGSAALREKLARENFNTKYLGQLLSQMKKKNLLQTEGKQGEYLYFNSKRPQSITKELLEKGAAVEKAAFAQGPKPGGLSMSYASFELVARLMQRDPNELLYDLVREKIPENEKIPV